MRNVIVLAGLAGLAGLAACGKPAATGNSSATTATTGGSGGGALLGASWPGDDACKTLDKSEVASATGSEVTETKLDGVSTLKEGPAAVSSCYYTLKSGGTVAVLTRQTEETSNTPAAMKDMRDQVGGMMGPVENVPGVGRSAFWIVKGRQLDVFVGDQRYFNITVPQDLGGKDPKMIALALAAKLT